MEKNSNQRIMGREHIRIIAIECFSHHLFIAWKYASASIPGRRELLFRIKFQVSSSTTIKIAFGFLDPERRKKRKNLKTSRSFRKRTRSRRNQKRKWKRFFSSSTTTKKKLNKERRVVYYLFHSIDMLALLPWVCTCLDTIRSRP